MSTQYVLLPVQDFYADLELAYVQSPDGRSVLRQGHAPLVLLDRLPQTVLVVPAQRLSFHQINLPKAPAGKLKTALEGLLEDLLLDEPSQVAIAIAPHAQEKKACWIAVYDKTWIKAMIEAFDAAGHSISRIIPQNYPDASIHIEVYGTEDSPWLIRADQQGVLSSPLQHAALLCQDLPPSQTIYCPANLATAVESVLNRAPNIRSMGQAILQAATTEWDLAQFDIKVGASHPFFRKFKKAWDSIRFDPPWRYARWGFVLLLVSQLVGLNFVAWKQSQLLLSKKQEKTQIFEKTFPQIRPVVQPVVQMAKQLDLLRQNSTQLSHSDFETLLSVTGLILPEGIQVTDYQYQDQQLLISGVPNEAFMIQNMQAQAKQIGYELIQQGERLLLRRSALKSEALTPQVQRNTSAASQVGPDTEEQP